MAMAIRPFGGDILLNKKTLKNINQNHAFSINALWSVLTKDLVLFCLFAKSSLQGTLASSTGFDQ